MDEYAECAICLINEIVGEEKCTNDCGHSFCKSCIDSWFDSGKNNCPLCRQQINYFDYKEDRFRVVFKTPDLPASTHIEPNGLGGPARPSRPVINDNANLIQIDKRLLSGYRLSLFFVSVVVGLQGLLIYNLKQQRHLMTEEYDSCIRNNSALNHIITTNQYTDQGDGDIVFMFDTSINNFVRCLIPEYYIRQCFS